MNNAIVKRYPLANSFPILLIVCLILEQGYGLLPIPRYLFIVLVGVFFFYYKKGTSYSKPISIFVVSCFLSILSCMYFRNESPVSIMGEYNIYLMIVFYFVLCKYNVSIEVLEKAFPGKGEYYATKIKDCTITLYKKCAEYALSKGIIIADTKFEFGLDEDGNVVIGDEMLTPDSSRFWPLEGYKPGQGQPSFDKQFVRDWLKANPDNDLLLPDEVVTKTVDKYKEAYELLTGTPFSK